jgi:hypothetical protein
MQNLFIGSNSRFVTMLAIGLCFAKWGSAQQEKNAANPQTVQLDSENAPSIGGKVLSSVLAPEPSETWTTPSLEGSHLQLIEELQLQNDETDPKYVTEVTRVAWRNGDPIDLYIMKPVGVKKAPLVAYLLDYPHDNDAFLKPELCRALAKKGLSAVFFATALTGQRYQGRPMKEWFVSELPEALATSAHDVQMILDYLGNRGDADVERTSVYGEGSGASIAILAAAVDSRIKTLDLVSPWGDWPDWMAKSTRIPENERANFLKPEFLGHTAPLDPVKWLPELKTQRVRIRNVRSLTETPVTAQEKIEAVAPANVEIVRYDNAQAYASAVTSEGPLGWIGQHLQHAAARHDRGNKSALSTNPSAKGGDSQR